MAQVIEVDPDQLRKAAELMAQVGEALEAAATELDRVLEAAGEPWSDDEYGEEFYQGHGKSIGYETSSKDTLKDFEGLVSAVKAYATNMRGAADDLEHTDRTAFHGTAA